MRDKKVVWQKSVDKESQDIAMQELKIAKQRLKVKRNTVQIRIREEWHALVSKEAHENGLTRSRLLDQICRSYFGKNGWRKAKKLSRKTMRSER